MNSELNFVLDVLQEKPSIPGKDLDWYWILGFLELNKIGGYFFHKTKDYEIKLPQSAERKLSQVLKIQSERNRFMRKYIQDIGDELRYEKLRFAFLKGSVLSNTNFRFSEKSFSCMALPEETKQTYRRQAGEPFYGEGERVSNDIDLLVEQKDISAISEVLKNMGFVQGYYDFRESKIVPLPRAEILSRRMNRGETAPFVLETDDPCVPFVEVDINFSLDYLPNSHEEMLHAVLKDSLCYAGNIQGGIRSLRADDFFLHLIMHQYKESVLYSMVQRSKDTELYKLLDIYLFIKRGYIELSDLHNKVKKYGLERPVYSVMSSISELFSDFHFSDYASMFQPKDGEDEVVDPPTGRKFVWEKPLSERINFFDKECFLREVKDE